MEFKKLANSTINFGINRIIETAGIALTIIGFLLLVSLATFSPDDPNFIFPDNTEIKNLLGFNGSYTADLFFSSFWSHCFINSIYTYIFRHKYNSK